MSSLSSLLVQRGVVAMRVVEDAIARQVVREGDFATNLLELSPESEPGVTLALGEWHSIEAAPSGPLADPDPAALRLVPVDLAQRHNLFPLRIEAGALVIATSEPLPESVEDDLAFALSVRFRQLASPLVRVQEAIAKHYGVPLDRRMERLAQKLGGKAAAFVSTAPPDDQAAAVEEARRAQTKPLGVASVAPEAPVAPVASVAPAATGPFGSEVRGTFASDPHAERPRTLRFLRKIPVRDRRDETSSVWRSGPFPRAEAEAALAEASSTDAVLDVLLHFASQLFEYAAVFTVHGEVAEGRDATGPGASREIVARLGVPLDAPGLLSMARDQGELSVAALSDGTDRELCAVLERDSAGPAWRQLAALPILIRDRAVAILLGDGGRLSIDIAALSDLVDVASLVSAALERLVLARKAHRSPREEKPRNQAETPAVAKASSHPPARAIRASSASSPSMLAALPPPPATAAAKRPITDRPIRREDSGPTAPVLNRDFEPAAAPPHREARSVPPDPIASELAPVLQRLIQGGSGTQAAFADLVRRAEHAMPSIMQSFPGPLLVERHSAALPPASQCGALLGLIIAIKRPALPFVTVRSASLDREIRFWATHLLGEMLYQEAASALLPRLFDQDDDVRRVARRSAASLVAAGAPGEPLLHGLDDLTRNADEAAHRRILAIETMGEIRDAQVVPPLLSALRGSNAEVAAAAHKALLLVTRHDFARDLPRWTKWWTENCARHRIEWLIDALTADAPLLRRAAADELKLLTKQYFGFHDDLPPSGLARVQDEYRAWWEREGGELFN